MPPSASRSRNSSALACGSSGRSSRTAPLDARSARPVEPADVEQGIPEARDALVVLHHHGLDARPRRDELEHRVDHVVDRAKTLATVRMRNVSLCEERAAPLFVPSSVNFGSAPYMGIPSRRARSRSSQVVLYGTRWARSGSPASERISSRTLEQLGGERRRAAVVRAHQVQPPPPRSSSAAGPGMGRSRPADGCDGCAVELEVRGCRSRNSRNRSTGEFGARSNPLEVDVVDRGDDDDAGGLWSVNAPIRSHSRHEPALERVELCLQLRLRQRNPGVHAGFSHFRSCCPRGEHVPARAELVQVLAVRVAGLLVAGVVVERVAVVGDLVVPSERVVVPMSEAVVPLPAFGVPLVRTGARRSRRRRSRCSSDPCPSRTGTGCGPASPPGSCRGSCSTSTSRRRSPNWTASWSSRTGSRWRCCCFRRSRRSPPRPQAGPGPRPDRCCVDVSCPHRRGRR